jgi:alginate O-acetyltransferase complex protein AlgI
MGWVFFRSPGLKYALRYLGVMFGRVQPENIGFTPWFYFSPKIVFMLCLATVASTPVLQLLNALFKVDTSVIRKEIVSALVLVLFFVCIVFVTASSYNPFIYFRF